MLSCHLQRRRRRGRRACIWLEELESARVANQSQHVAVTHTDKHARRRSRADQWRCTPDAIVHHASHVCESAHVQHSLFRCCQHLRISNTSQHPSFIDCCSIAVLRLASLHGLGSDAIGSAKRCHRDAWWQIHESDCLPRVAPTAPSACASSPGCQRRPVALQISVRCKCATCTPPLL